MALIDVSPLISEEIANWPGDVPFSRSVQMTYSKGDHLELSSISTSLHVGSHADAPIHFEPEARGVDAVELEPYYGECLVVEVARPELVEGTWDALNDGRILPAEIEQAMNVTGQVSRILLKTNSFPNPNNWNEDFRSLSVELIEFLSEKGVKLIKIDTPSVDPFTDKGLSSHKALLKYHMRHLEGLVLSHVVPGRYKLIALPLKIKGADASPVRAVLEKY